MRQDEVLQGEPLSFKKKIRGREGGLETVWLTKRGGGTDICIADGGAPLG